jgi:hypothetical protein
MKRAGLEATTSCGRTVTLWLGVCIIPRLRDLPTAVQSDTNGGKDKHLS